MKRLTLFYILLTCFAVMLHAQPKQELRAVWLTTLEGLDWPSTKGMSAAVEQKQKQELCRILDQFFTKHVSVERSPTLPASSHGTVVSADGLVQHLTTTLFSLLLKRHIKEAWNCTLGSLQSLPVSGTAMAQRIFDRHIQN